jgi:hypothetical protein
VDFIQKNYVETIEKTLNIITAKDTEVFKKLKEGFGL